ncbi:N(G),N(G)-dimethylarginine dimethylaminohydrolase 1-like isoform X2 [Symsagittifera roscoffensis]|uniref:N(G),N(G)-dimethylarginine dimethylaminohydrolase 1-like isoform X2 n=1 Tax=Symsagittifera roscoffensis TaxID=84072 RepID=UPI00307C00A0
MSEIEINCAVLRAPSKSCVSGVTQRPIDEPVKIEGAMAEHEYTKEVVKKVGLKLYEVEADEEYPDCVFIEDPVFFLDGVAFFPQAGHPSRRGEKGAVLEFVKKHFPTLKCVEMTGEGYMDGGDICFLGGEKKEILCGVSTRTNEEGVRQLQAAYPDYTVTPIPIPTVEEGGLLHLITHCSRYASGPYLAIGKSEASQRVKKNIEERAISKVEFFEVPDDWAANCIYVNGYVLHCSQEEYPESFKAYQEKFGDKAIPLKNKEFDKIDGSLTCRVRLLKYPL